LDKLVKMLLVFVKARNKKILINWPWDNAIKLISW